MMKPIMTNMEQASPAPTDSRRAAKERLVRAIGPSMCPDSKGNVETSDEIDVNFNEFSVRYMQSLYPVPERLDPFTEALLGGVDPVAVHQTLTLSYPILAFLGYKARVLYADGILRWMCGQSWQMGGSGSGKSIVLRSLENLFLARELTEKNVAAKKEADYSQLPEEKRNKTPKPRAKLRILDAVPSAIAMLEQMQINGDGLMYLSCTEGGEFAKKISSQYYALILDMMKKSYDSTGEAFINKTKERTYFVPSMKLCCNIGGTIDPIYKILRHCDSDGTLSRGTVTILGERKDEKMEGAYKRPKWTTEQMAVLHEGAYRLRRFDNRFNENENFYLNDNDDENSLERAYEGAKDSEGNAPTFEEYCVSVQEERERLALSVPEIIALGKEIKADLARWWTKCSIDCALAVQRQLNANSRSHREEIRLAYKEAIGASAESTVKIRDRAFGEFETLHAGEVVNTTFVKDNISILGKMSLRNIKRLIDERGWPEAFHGKYVVTGKGKNDDAKEKQ